MRGLFTVTNIIYICDKMKKYLRKEKQNRRLLLELVLVEFWTSAPAQ